MDRHGRRLQHRPVSDPYSNSNSVELLSHAHPYTAEDDINDDNHPDHPPPSPPPDMHVRRLARRIERACCTCATYFPLAFVYGLSTWACWVVIHLGTTPEAYSHSAWTGPWCAWVGLSIYIMQIWSYTAAVFTPPGSTTNDQGYSTVPTNSASPFNGLTDHNESVAARASAAGSLTVKSNGEMRFCKKCQARKPDRAHHCSTCRRCVLKMDHHCPWLATCIGLRNGKMFLLFLIYTSSLSLFSFAVAGSWVWTEIVNDATYTTAGETLMPVQYIMLTVVGGIIGFAVGLFTVWHIVLASRGQTTIECMEKTRYSSSLRGSMPFTAAATVAGAIGDGISTLSANAQAAAAEHGVPLPQYGRQMNNMNGNRDSYSHSRTGDEEQGLFAGVQGAHDDDDDDDDNTLLNYSSSVASASTTGPQNQMGRRLTYDELERYRAQKRHDAYMDEQDSAKMPHAFDLGTRRNLLHMFGPSPWLWPLPVPTTTGDGWTWEPSPKWVAARERIQRDRDAQRARERAAGWGMDDGDDASSSRAPPIVVTHATPPRYNPQQRFQNQRAAPPNLNLHPSSSSSRSQPSRYRRSPLSPSKADRILGRDPNQGYTDATGNTNDNTNPNAVSMQRLNRSGRKLPDDDIDLFEDDDDDVEEDEEEEENDDDLDNTSEEDATTLADVPVLTPTQSQSQSQQRGVSPLRARWMPDPTSGLLRKASSTGSSGAASPTAAGATSPTGTRPGSADSGAHQQPQDELDDGSVD
ncbi:palmitoyltransferase for Vac8p [Sporothrix stenoceras]|uniref:Palmitoyltransferase n=1 Tax=Sporothrix stenoceras TaxID=5173 RepID=A0ABR3Z5C5_9PEZI